MKSKRLKHIKKCITLIKIGKALQGYRYKYLYKVNIHKCVFKKTLFVHARFRAGSITQVNFNESNFKNIDFVSVNFKKSTFKNSYLNNVLFFSCNLTKVNFQNSKLENVILINCKIKDVKNLDMSKVKIINSQKNYNISDKLKNTMNKISSNKKLERFSILFNTQHNINITLINQLVIKYGEEECIRMLEHININQRNIIYSFFDYVERFEKIKKI